MLVSEFASLCFEELESEIGGFRITFWGFEVEAEEKEQSLRRVVVGIRLKLEMSANGSLFLFIDLELFGLFL